MALRYNKSTYAELIDDLRFDLNRGAELTALPDEAIQLYILQAEQALCQEFDIIEEYALTLAASTSDYQFQDRPPITGASNAAPIVITAAGHGLVDEDMIHVVDVLGNTGANGDFEVDNAATTFELKSSTGTAAWTSGGRFWKTTEIPTFFRTFTAIKRVWSSITYFVELVDISTITRRVALDGLESASGYTAPLQAAIFRKDGKRYLKFYPTPTDTMTITLYGPMQVVPRDYSSDPLTTAIHLPVDYNEAVKAFCRWKIMSWLKDAKSVPAEFEQYRYLVSEIRKNIPTVRRREITYQ